MDEKKIMKKNTDTKEKIDLPLCEWRVHDKHIWKGRKVIVIIKDKK